MTATDTSHLEDTTCSSLCRYEDKRNPRIVNIACLAGGCGTENFAAVYSIPIGHHASTSVNLSRNAIVVGHSHTLIVNLTILRNSGRVFDRFFTLATVRRDAGCLLMPLLTGIKFEIRLDGALAWSRTFKKETTLRVDLHVPSTAMSLSLVVHRTNSVRKNSIRDCFSSEWLKPLLRYRSPLPQCYRECLSSRSGPLYLQCFLPVCPGRCTETDTKSHFIDFGGDKVCSECNITNCSLNQPVMRSIVSVSNSSVAVNIGAIKRRGYQFDVFSATVALEIDDPSLCSSPVAAIFTVYVDSVQALSRTVGQIGTTHPFRIERTRVNTTMERDILVAASGAKTLVLQAAIISEMTCNATVKWQNPRLVKFPLHPILSSCDSSCADALNQGRIYLSCFLGACSGAVTRSSNPPFFTLNYHSDSVRGPGYGIGVNRAVVWEKGRNSIELNNGHENIPFLFGIGAYPSSSISFDLDAFRAHGYRFNFLTVTMGIDSASGCKSHHVSSVVFRIYLDNEMVCNQEIGNTSIAPAMGYSLGSTSRLTMVTAKGISLYDDDVMVCYNAVWTQLELMQVVAAVPRPV